MVLWEMATLAEQPYQGFTNDQVGWTIVLLVSRQQDYKKLSSGDEVRQGGEQDEAA